MPGRKRKRAWDAECTSFPDEIPPGLRKANAGTAVAATSISSAWLKCGDGFQSTSMLETSESSEKKSRADKHLGPLLTSAEGTLGVSTAVNPEEFADIIWSSSGSDFSDDENKILISRLYNQKSHGSKAQKSYSKHNLLSEDRSSEGELQFIDWEKDSDPGDSGDECGGPGKDDSALDISDSDSCASSNSLPLEEKEGELPKTVSTEISEYSSDSENLEEGQRDTESSNFGFSKKLQSSSEADLAQATGRSASDWLKSAQALLQTPKKQLDKTSRTPEDSAKKRKLLRGGLAERLNRLQNRERSAISFWKHQCVSEYKTSSGGKSGVLIVKILEVHEECTIQVALCQHFGQLSADSSSEDVVVDTEPRVKVLFTKETAAYLKGGPQDIVHIYPPWQKLLLHNENVPVIMNTYFSQKILLKDHAEVKDRTRCPEKLHIRRNVISLAQIFRLNDLRDSLPQESAVNQVACTNVITPKTVQTNSNPESKLHSFALSVPNDSLLEVVESQGAVGWKEVQVQVVVQRAYYLPSREGFRCQLQGNNPIRYATPILNSDLPNVRLCLLVQDAYGMFSEVQLQTLCFSEDIEQHSRRWEGKSCTLVGIRILQRTTRGRALGLFSLIDSLWPPLVPLKVPGQSQDCETIKTNLPPPSFCYILTAQPDPRHVNIGEEGQISNFYLPPTIRSLKEILQVGDFNQRCSFWAQVIYRRLQVKCSVSVGQREFWLFVTDFALQSGAKDNCGTPKTVPVYFASSCVLGEKVMEALGNVSHCVIFFKDALQKNGRIICVERTILSLQKPLLYTAAEADFSELTSPVKLDELDSTTQANSICTVRGTISGVNKNTAFSRPTCNRCGNGKLEQHPQDRGSYYCSLCSQMVILPVLKMQLEVFLHCPSRPHCTVKVKLLQKTISSVLIASSSEDGSYEVKSVLGKEVGLLNCYVQSVTNHPSCVVLEEIVLLEARRN
ncbi:DNA repair-scaffolding protein isoform X2 [Chelonoidis abingdonii]|uniref:DNA repair-scaffolding protein isoform X2 n=1 Tax=Chelonoidis abingdonii TaxID=106734 RepID=UPI0013F196DE|nr:DNA repair-scaffolding protein isoform X1 [Chelonoidis abingdonii]